MVLKSNLLILLNGTHNLYKSINPTSPVMMTHMVETSSCESLINEGRKEIMTMFKVIVRAVGKDFFNTLMIILPFILSLLGSRAKTNDGMPIVTTLVKVS